MKIKAELNLKIPKHGQLLGKNFAKIKNFWYENVFTAIETNLCKMNPTNSSIPIPTIEDYQEFFYIDIQSVKRLIKFYKESAKLSIHPSQRKIKDANNEIIWLEDPDQYILKIKFSFDTELEPHYPRPHFAIFRFLFFSLATYDDLNKKSFKYAEKHHKFATTATNTKFL